MLRTTVIATSVLALSASAFAATENFDSVPVGTVIGGELPQGGMADAGSFFPFLEVVQVINNSGPNSAIIFDSSNPTGQDQDLGTPNEACPGGGPGVGAGGAPGAPGENCVPLNNIVVIAEDLGDANADNIVDDPDDDRDGGTISFFFDTGVTAATVQIIDIDSESAELSLTDGVLTLNATATDLGNNSVQTLDLTGIGIFHCLEIVFSSSGGIGDIEVAFPVSVEEQSWSSIKSAYR